MADKTYDEQVKENMDTIEMLKQRIIELEKKRDEVIKDINKPIYEAKAKADKIVAEAQAEAKQVTEAAEKLKVEVDTYAKKRTAEAEELSRLAKISLSEAEKDKKAFEDEKVEFGAYKYSIETKVRESQQKADQIIASNIQLQNELNELRGNLDSRESIVIKKESDNQAILDQANKVKQETEQMIENFKAESGNIDKKAEELQLEMEKSKKLISELGLQRGELQKEIFTNNELLKKITATNNEIKANNLKNDQQLVAMDKKANELKDQEAANNEKERSIKLLDRDVKEQIKILQKLREEDQKRKEAAGIPG